MGDEDSAAILVAALQARSLTIIGLMTWWVAHQQKKINRQQLEINGHRIKLDLYDRRWAVYEATERFMEQVINGRIPDFPVTRSHPPASWPSAANSSICRTYRKTAGEESRRRSPVANRWMRP